MHGGATAGSRILYVGGAGRSGSTLLGRVIGQVPGFVHVGELVFVWRRGVLDNQLCGCGEPFLDCPFWSQVGLAAFGGWRAEAAREAEALRMRVERTRHIPALLSPAVPGRFRRDLADYTDLLAELYRAVEQVSGSQVIVETSKGPSHAFLLRHVPGVDLRVCLLVRDSRGVAYSWTRRKRRPEIDGAVTYMDNYSTTRAAAEWTSFNAAFSCGPIFGLPTQRLRYEDFVHQPAQELARLVEFAGLDSTGLPELFGPGTVRLSSDHSMAGNPSRFTSGEVELVADEEWREAMPAQQRRLMTAMTAPWLLRYGYFGRSDDAAHS